VLASRPVAALVRQFGARLVTDLVREQLAALRDGVRAGRLDGPALAAAVRAPRLAAAIHAAAATLLEPRPRPVINATGVIVHTNLGRSVLSPAAAREVATAATSYLDLEYDLLAGERGQRMAHLEPLMARLFPGAAFTVVNNNAAAILLCLRALSLGREVIVSRGELVEIGGSFRIPDILAVSGARLREVGTTNRTRAADYERALGPATGVILKVHTSNFRIVGFTEQAPLSALAALAARAGLPLVVDWGSGDLIDLAPLGIRDEQPVSRLLAEGAGLVTFSGDKLLGGPQSGFVVGRPELVERVRREPLARVVRLDRLLIGALQRTLAAYVQGREQVEVPTLRMLAIGPGELERRAARLCREIARRTGAGRWLSVVDGISRPGGGSSPGGERPTRLVCVETPGGDAAGLDRRLRGGTPPVVGRIHEGRLLLDPRTVAPEEEPRLVARLAEALAEELRARR
jgi:L-seryl-tRNA(Ser) seleniumtransferase